MNVLLLEPEELAQDGAARVEGRRAEHVREVLGASVGDDVRVGVVGGRLGRGSIVEIDDASVTLRCMLADDPPPPLPIALVLALPRPPVARRTLQHVAAIGIKRIVLLHARRVEKSYWGSPSLRAAEVRRNLLLGLEQGRDTIVPTVAQRERFRPFVEDELPALIGGGTALLADAEGTEPCPANVAGPLVLVVGPEGGFIPFERELLIQHGCRPVTLGPRPLRTESAVSALVGRVMNLR